jgi:hypothetical protein
VVHVFVKKDPEGLEEMTVLRPWLGLEVVLLEGQFSAERLLFHSRASRLEFFAAVTVRLPERIYRSN